MHYRSLVSSASLIGAGLMFAAFAPSALAQENTTWIYTCQGVGASQPEPLGDKEGQ